jgi:PHP family Zn ribbon phosphoesterase
MPAFSADLHNHSPIANGDYLGDCDTSARQIVEAALGTGLDVYAVTDHFSCDFVPCMLQAAREVAEETGRRLHVIPGTEMRVTYRGDEVHVVALFDVQDYADRLDQLFAILGVRDELDEADQLHRVTVEYDPVEVTRIIDALGGVSIVAHVDRRFGAYRLLDSPLFERLVQEGRVHAVDVIDRAAHGSQLSQSGVNVISCSDSHATREIGRRRTLLSMPEFDFASLRTALQQPKTPALAS